MDNRPIGIFDSGLGGLTAACEFRTLLPSEHIIYLGDSANMPYGEKQHDRIVEMALNNLRFMLRQGVKAVFVACGTITTNALELLCQKSPVPVFGVVEAASDEAIAATKNGKIGLLATRASIQAGAFEKSIAAKRPDISVTSSACPKFASMVEDGITERHDPRLRAAADEYLPCLLSSGVDTVILGCTHYPLLADLIGDYMGPSVRLISSGAAAARQLASCLKENGIECEQRTGRTEFFTTGSAAAFAHSAAHMMGRDISSELLEIAPFDRA